MQSNNTLLQTLFRIQAELEAAGLSSEIYSIENCSGYSYITKNASDIIYCIETYLGANPKKPEANIYAISHVFWDKHPNLIFTTVVSLAADGNACGKAYFSKIVDKNFSTILLPVIYRAFNQLDPKGQLKSQVVQSYLNTVVMLEDFIPALFYTLRLLIGRSLTGQFATIAADFNDPATKIIAGLIAPLAKGGGIHIFPSESEKSNFFIPLRKRNQPDAEPFVLQGSSALDKAFLVAMQYLEKQS